MKIPVRQEIYDPETRGNALRDTDIVSELKGTAVSALSFVTQCDTGVTFGVPVFSRAVAGFDHFYVCGEFSSGDAWGELRFEWTVRHDSPEYYDVNRCAMRFGDLGWNEMEYHGDTGFVERASSGYRQFLDTYRFLPRHFPEIEDLLDRILKVPMPEKSRETVSGLAAKISGLLGNIRKI